MKTHLVLDLAYLPEEGQDVFSGTKQECDDFVASQSDHFMYKVVPMTKQEMDAYPENLPESKPVNTIRVEKERFEYTTKKGVKVLFQRLTKDYMWYAVANGQIVRWEQYRNDLKEWCEQNL